MEYTSQMWLWQDLFPAEKDAFPGVYPKKKQPARSTSNAPNTNTVTAANTGVTNNTNQTVTAANTGVTNNTTAARTVSSIPTPKIPPSTGGPSSLARIARAAHVDTGSKAKMEIKNKPAQVPRKTAPKPQNNKPVPNNPGFDHSSPAMLPLVDGYPQFMVKPTCTNTVHSILMFLGQEGQSVREVQEKLGVRLRYQEVDDKLIEKKVLIFFAEPFDKKDEKKQEVLYKCLAAWRFLYMWDRRVSQDQKKQYLQIYYKDWKKSSSEGEQMTDRKWAKYVEVNPSLAGLQLPKNTTTMKADAAAEAAKKHHNEEYKKVFEKVAKEWEPTSPEWADAQPSEEDIKDLIQANVKWDLVNRTYVRKTPTELDMEAASIEPSTMAMLGLVITVEGEGEGEWGSGIGDGKGKEKNTRNWD
jgi:hypothetical protein